MSLVPDWKRVEPVSLVRSVSVAEEPAIPAAVGRKVACGLADLFTGLMSAHVTVKLSDVRASGSSRSEEFAHHSIRVAPGGAAVSIAIPRLALMTLVDRYYGGSGASSPTREYLSPAEARFFTRITTAISAIFPAAWQPHAITAEALDQSVTPGEPTTAQVFQVSCDDWPAFEIECGYPRSFLERHAELQTRSDAFASGADTLAWQQQLMDGALHVPFAASVVLAEPEVTLSRLVSLRPGDIIPLSIPSQTDLTVSGTRVASGNIGESNGRAALRVDQV